MIRIGHELKVDFIAIDPTRDTKESLPIWHHIGANNALLELSSKMSSPQAQDKNSARAKHSS
jgi:hypothetical protein